MLKSIRVPLTFVRLGSVVLIFTAFLYLYLGYPYVSKGLSGASLDAQLSGELKAVWVGFCLHLFFIAYLLLNNSRRGNVQNLILALCGLIVLVDAFLVRVFLANTIGAQLLTVSGLLILLGSYFWVLFKRTNDKALI